MGDFLNDPTGLRNDGGKSKGGKSLMALLALVAVVLLGAGAWTHFSGRKEASEIKPQTASVPQRVAGPTTADADTTPAAEEVERTPEEKAEAEAELAQAELEPQVRADMCEDYGERYLAARTGVELVRSVQLSQAAGCGWEAMLHADAATHRFLPEALAVAKRMEAEEVDSIASTSSVDPELLDEMSRRIERIESTTQDIRRRQR